MKTYYRIPFLLLLTSLSIYSQQMPIGFNSNADNFSVFSGAGFSMTSDPNDGANTVGQFYNDGSNASQGFYLDLMVDIDFQQSITLSFYSFDLNPHNVLLKLESGTNADVQVKEEFTAASSAGWKTITFDFTNAQYSSNGAAVSATGTYGRLAIFIDEGDTIAGTYLIDDIADGTTATDPNVLDVIYTDLVWSDEFDGNGAIDGSKWHHQTFGPNGGQWFNGELQHYTNRTENSNVSGGSLNIIAKRENLTQNGVSLGFTSARLNSKYAFTYGRVDVKAKLPFGNATWPAIWTLGKNINETGAYWQTQGFGTTNWPACGEIDVMEHGLHATNSVSSALHTTSSSGATMNTSTMALSNVADNFYVYSMNWSPNQITFMIDGVGYYTYNKPAVFVDSNNDSIDDGWPFDLEQFLILNIAMGGFSGTPDAGFTESSMVIDYVRVYQYTPLSVDAVFNSEFSVYPNPASEQLYIESKQSISKIEIYSTLGQLVVRQKKETNKINTNHLKSGLYLMKIYSDTKVATKKIMIQN
jgi:beta-glucanase (GH16 family)